MPLAQEIDAINRDWRILWKRIRRAHPEKANGYVKVLELTKQGAPHLHIIVDAPYIPQRWLSAQWAQISGNPIVDVRLIGSARELSRYVSKYLTKGHGYDSSRRRWSQSNGFLPPLPPPTLEDDELAIEWHWHSHGLRDLHAYLIALGATHDDAWYVLPPDAGAALFGGGPGPPRR